MKCEIVIDKDHEEGVLIYVKEKNLDAERIEKFVLDLSGDRLFGYKDRECEVIEPMDVFCFIVEDAKVYAVLEDRRRQIKERLYQIEEQLDDCFVKLNQSCIANIGKIKSFDASFGGALTVTFKNGYRDYVSRRQMKTVKERLGLKL